MRKIIAVLLIAALLMPVVNAEALNPPELSAASAILVDGESGRVLYEKNAMEPRAIASITKLMTALIAMDCIENLADEVEIKAEWTGIEGSSIYLRPGESITVEGLLYGLLLQSGNDAAVAIASHCAGSVDAFVERMNMKARELGMTDTRFQDPHGLSEENHYSTAYDMALLGRACSENDLIAEIISTRSKTIGTRTFVNHNKLLWLYDKCTGMKTGYTRKAGRTLVSSAEQDGQTLIAVTLNAQDDWNDHKKLFEYGFQHYSKSVLCTEGETIKRIPVHGGLVTFVPAVTADEICYPLLGSENITAHVTLPESLEAPIEQGMVLGEVSYFLANQCIGKTDLLAGYGVNRTMLHRHSLLEKIMDLFLN